jgi:cation:H+ antiporter
MNPIDLVQLCFGLLLLVAGAEALVRGASRLAESTGVSPLVVGLTVVAFGTSAPELAVSIQSVLGGSPDLAVGNAVGSNIFNVLFILGLAALVAPLTVAQRLVRIDVPLLIVVSLGLYALAFDGQISRLDGCVLFTGIVAYTIFAIRSARRARPEVRTQYQEVFGVQRSSAGPRVALMLQAIWVVAGLALLILGSRWLVSGSVGIARGFGVSELVIGLTVIAAGTSMPELATSVMASVRGQRDIAVGNVVGSNLFNILAVLGASATVSSRGVAVAPGALALDIPIMIVVAVACLPVFFTGHRIDRWEGVLFLGYYVAYTAYLVMHASRDPLVDEFRVAVLWFALPLTAITLAIAAWRSLHRRKTTQKEDSTAP